MKEKPMNRKEKRFTEILPLLPVSDTVVFPRMIIPLMIKEEEYSELVNDALQKDKLIIVAMAEDSDTIHKGSMDFHRVGTVGQVIRLSKGDEETVLVIQGIYRAAISEIVSTKPYNRVKIKKLDDVEYSGREIDAMITNIRGLFKRIIDLSPHLPDELFQLARNVDQPGPLADLIVSTLNMDRAKKQEILECPAYVTPVGLVRWGKFVLDVGQPGPPPLLKQLRGDARKVWQVVKRSFRW